MARKKKEIEFAPYVPELSIYDRLNAGEFENKLPWERHSKDQAVWDAYNVETARLTAAFKLACEEDHGFVGHPKADLLWSKAWEHGHSSGLYEVYNYYNDFADFLK
ncbi:MAG: hypothetical protein ACREBR_04995 [bacterium]